MNYEEQRRQRLMTVLAAAVRIGRAGPLSDDTVGAELRDLAELYLAAEPQFRYIGSFDNTVTDTVKLSGFYGQAVPEELRTSILDQAAELVREEQVQRGVCGFETPAYESDGHVDHDHCCDKAAGHANGPGGSDHHCEGCGALFDEKGNSASPLGMAPLTRNRPDDELTEVEL